MNGLATNVDASLADALRKTRDCLLGKIETQEEERAHRDDCRVLRAADKALMAYGARQSAVAATVDAAVERASLIRQLRAKGLVVVVWSAKDVPPAVSGDPQAWLSEHRQGIEAACITAGSAWIESCAALAPSTKEK